MDMVYFIVKKNMDGIYLLDKRNEILVSATNEAIVRDMFNSITPTLNNKYYFFCKHPNDKFLQVIATC